MMVLYLQLGQLGANIAQCGRRQCAWHGHNLHIASAAAHADHARPVQNNNLIYILAYIRLRIRTFNLN
jgi:hypothetical protein